MSESQHSLMAEGSDSEADHQVQLPQRGRFKPVAFAVATSLAVSLAFFGGALHFSRHVDAKPEAFLEVKAEETPGGLTSVVRYGRDGRNSCPNGFAPILSERDCRAAMPLIKGGDPNYFQGSEDDGNFPGGCYFCSKESCNEEGVWFNKASPGIAVKGGKLVCQQNLNVELGKTLFVGDSDIDYWNTFASAVPDSYNVGIGGDTCANKLKEIDKLLKDFKPSSVVLCCGENDLAFGADVDTTFKRWTRVVKKITQSGARIIMMGTKPEPDTKNLHNKYKMYDSKVRGYIVAQSRLVKSPPVALVDVYASFEALGNPRNLYASDELHMSKKGYKLWDQWVATAHGDDSGCAIWRSGECIWADAQAMVISAPSKTGCPARSHERITDEAACEAASASMQVKEWHGSEEDQGWPSGCYYCGKGVKGCKPGTWFNTASSDKAKQGVDLLCKSVHAAL